MSSIRASAAGERLYADMSGPYTASIVGSKYLILFVDNYSRKSWSYFVNAKNAVSHVADGLLQQLK